MPLSSTVTLTNMSFNGQNYKCLSLKRKLLTDKISLRSLHMLNFEVEEAGVLGQGALIGLVEDVVLVTLGGPVIP